MAIYKGNFPIEFTGGVFKQDIQNNLIFLGNTLVYGSGSLALVFDPDAEAFFTRVTTAGGSLNFTEQIAVNQLVLDLKGFSLFTKMIALYPMVGSSAASCAQNLKSSSFTGTFSGTSTFSSTGVAWDGTTGFMNTGFNPNTFGGRQNNIHLSYYSRTNNTTNAAEMGCVVTGITAQLQIFLYFNNSNVDSVMCVPPATAATNTSGFFITTRANASNFQGYRNGTSTYNLTAASSTPLNNTIILGARRLDANAELFTNRESALASIGDSFNATEAANFNTAVTAFQTTLSRNV